MNANLMVSADPRTYISFMRISAYTTEWRNQMTKMKALSTVVILSAAIATPVFAQGPHHGRAQDQFRGAYNQLNGSVYAAPDAQDRRNVEDFGFSGRDPSRPGGEDPSLNPSGS
jgi:hypothetical protein